MGCLGFPHKPKLLSPHIFRWGRGLPREGVGAKKFDMSLETRETKPFWRDIPGFCRDIPEAPQEFEKKMFVFNFWPLLISMGAKIITLQNVIAPNSYRDQNAG